MEQRRCIILQGDAGWQHQAVNSLLAQFDSDRVIVVSQQNDIEYRFPTVDFHRTKTVIGQDLDAVVFCVDDHFAVDSFGLVVGTIRAGGALILCFGNRLPASLWMQRFISITQTYLDKSEFDWYQQGETLPTLVALPERNPTIIPTADQQQAVEAIIKVVTGHRRRPLVMTADRGRGKSAALGMAAAKLLSDGKQKIIITAPSLSAVDSVFIHAKASFPNAVVTNNKVTLPGGELCFMAPDALCQSDISADLVMVDEAAAIPSRILQQLLSKFSRLVFATTQHGYEGTGRGFTVRFQSILSALTPDWRSYQLITPVRWRSDDQLEAWSFEALLFNASPVVDEDVAQAQLADCQFERIPAQTLVADTKLLQQAFGLMVLAHYRTRPSDLQLLLDNPDVSLYVVRHQSKVIACDWLMTEGEFEPVLSDAVYRGERRLSGHLLPQSLLAHVGLDDAGKYRYQRIVRLAVHPAVQRRGIGQALVDYIADAIEAQCEVLGASFACDHEMLAFWQQCGFELVRLGIHRDEVSGCYASVMLRPLSSFGQSLHSRAVQRFEQQWDDLLLMQFKSIESELVIAIAQLLPLKLIQWSDIDWQDITRYGQAQAGYAFCQLALRQYIAHMIRRPVFMMLSEQAQSLCVKRILQNQPVPVVCSALHLTGKNELDVLLRQTVAELVAFSLEDDITTATE